MKISTFELDITPCKYKYTCEWYDKLVERFSPQKTTPYSVEFIEADFDRSEAVVFNLDKKLDFVLIDLEKIEKRLARVTDEKERYLLEKAAKILETEKLLCEVEFSPEEHAILKTSAFVSYKPCIGKKSVEDINSLIAEVIEKSGVLLFFTAGKKEVRAWDIKKGQTALDAAARIHSDLARGFIKAEIVNLGKIDDFFNMNEARSRGLVKVVDRDYIMEPGDIIEVRFNV